MEAREEEAFREAKERNSLLSWSESHPESDRRSRNSKRVRPERGKAFSVKQRYKWL